MRLVVQFQIGDGCTYSCTETIAVVYDSAEQLLVDLEDAVNNYIKSHEQYYKDYEKYENIKSFDERVLAYQEQKKKLFALRDTTLPKTNIILSYFIENNKFEAPTIMTVDEWFGGRE